MPMSSIAIGCAGPRRSASCCLLLDQPADRPGVAFAPQIQDRLVQADVVDREALRNQLEHVVVEAEILHRHDLAAVHRHADVLQLDAEEQIAAEPLDRQRAVQILIRLAHDVAAQPVLEPCGLRDDDRRRRRADEQRQHDQQHVNEPPHESACRLTRAHSHAHDDPSCISERLPDAEMDAPPAVCGSPFTSSPGIGLS